MKLKSRRGFAAAIGIAVIAALTMIWALSTLAAPSASVAGTIETDPTVVSPDNDIPTGDRTVIVRLRDPDLSLPVFVGEGPNGEPPEIGTADGERLVLPPSVFVGTYIFQLIANPIGPGGGSPIADRNRDGKIDKIDIQIVNPDLDGDNVDDLSVTGIFGDPDRGNVQFVILQAGLGGKSFFVRYATSAKELSRAPKIFTETVAAPLDLQDGETFTVNLKMDWLPLQDTNGDGVLSTADISVISTGRSASNTPVVGSIGQTAILDNRANGLAAGNQIILLHRGSTLPAGTLISITYTGLEDLVTVKGVQDVEIPLRMRESAAGSGVFEATVIAIDGTQGQPDSPNRNLDPTSTGTIERPHIAVVQGGAITVTYRDRAPASTITSDVLVSVFSADFSGAPRQGLAPLNVSFKDEATGATEDIKSWTWQFGDGGTSTAQNPSHTYQMPGIYTVSLTITSGDVVSTMAKQDFIKAVELTGQRFSQVAVEVLRERINWSGSNSWSPTGKAVELDAWDRVVIELTLHSENFLGTGLMAPGLGSDFLESDYVSSSHDFAFAQRLFRKDQTYKRAFIAPISGSYPLMVAGSGEFSIVVTRHIPTIQLPGRGDVNADKVVDVLDLAIVASNLGRRFDGNTSSGAAVE